MIGFDEFRELHHAFTLLGMSGVGKTVLSTELRHSANWYHYSADYRIGTRYLAEDILDNVKFKIMQMEDPFVAKLLRSDSIYINHNISVDNLDPVSTFLGMYGDAREGGLDKKTFLERQELYRHGEVEAMKDTAHFIRKAWNIYHCKNFINDASGSLCEIADPNDPRDPVFRALQAETMIIYILADAESERELLERAKSHPKPMFYNHDFITPALEGKPEDGAGVSPFDFARPLFPELLKFRKPRYQGVADNFGFTINVSDLFRTNDADKTVPDSDTVLQNIYDAVLAQTTESNIAAERFESYMKTCSERYNNRTHQS